jgi:hypothetical protein
MLLRIDFAQDAHNKSLVDVEKRVKAFELEKGYRPDVDTAITLTLPQNRQKALDIVNAWFDNHPI